MKDELKPCPFCGCKVFVGKYTHDGRVIASIICHELQTEPCIISQPSTMYNSEEFAIAEWNKRL